MPYGTHSILQGFHNTITMYTYIKPAAIDHRYGLYSSSIPKKHHKGAVWQSTYVKAKVLSPRQGHVYMVALVGILSKLWLVVFRQLFRYGLFLHSFTAPTFLVLDRNFYIRVIGIHCF